MSSFPAKYPGSCLCGARFQTGAKIYWDRSISRATGCPTCCPKAKAGTPFTLSNGLCVSFDTHPTTGDVVLCQLTDPCGAWNACEVYALKDGRWSIRSYGREMVLRAAATHEQVLGWLAQVQAATPARFVGHTDDGLARYEGVGL